VYFQATTSLYPQEKAFDPVLFETGVIHSKSVSNSKFKAVFYDRTSYEIPPLGIRIQPDLLAVGFIKWDALKYPIAATAAWPLK